MIQNLDWAPKAKKDYDDNIEYILLEFGTEVTLKFINEVDLTIELIKQGNITFKSTEYKEVYKIIIVSKITLFYRVDKVSNTLELVRFWNNKKDPRKFKL